MWTTEHSIETSAEPEEIWRLWRDVRRWPEWNADLAESELVGPFEAGSTIRMTSHDGETIELRLVDVAEPVLFVDEADVGNVVVRTTHRLEQADTGSLRVVYRMGIGGPEADAVGPELGPQISGAFPEVLASLVARAERG